MMGANFNFNKVILGGRLTADPELKQTTIGTAFCTFGVAVNRRYSKNADEQKADFFNVTAWREQANFVSRFFRKGSSICVVGTIQNRSWVDKTGEKRYATDIVADEVMFVDGKGDGFAAPEDPHSYIPAGTGTDPVQFVQTVSQQNMTDPAYDPMYDDDSLPF